VKQCRQFHSGLQPAVHPPGMSPTTGRGRPNSSPCHNSLFSIDGRVLAGPAPRPLDRYETKGRWQETPGGPPDRAGASGMKRHWNRFSEWLDHRTGVQTAVPPVFLYEEIPASSGWQQSSAAVAVFRFWCRRSTGALLGLQLRAHARGRLQQPALHPHGIDRWPADPRAAPLGRQHDESCGCAPHGPGLPLWGLQEAARSHLDGGCGADLVTWHTGLTGIPVALGQSRLLGNGGHHPDRRAGSGGGAVLERGLLAGAERWG